MRRQKPKRLKKYPNHLAIRIVSILICTAAAALLAVQKSTTEDLFSPPDTLVDAAFNSTTLSGKESPPIENADSSQFPDITLSDKLETTPSAPTVTTPPETPLPPSPTPSPSPIDLDPYVRTVTVIPSESDGHANYDGIYVKNETGYEIDVRSYLESELDDTLRNNPKHIIIVHTHASEAFYPDGEDIYEPTDVQRTEDTNFNVVRLGDILAEKLTGNGFTVTHIREIFDYPSYAGSYTRALEALTAAFDEHPETAAIIDIHRDAITTADGSVYRTVADTDRGRAAQMMFVIGTDENGLKHTDWRQNLATAIHLQKRIIADYPGLMRPIALSRSRYNQHLTSGSMILEIGASGNTLREAMLSTEIFAEQLSGFFDDISY